MEQAGESQLDGKNPPAPIPRTRPSRVCAQETGERSRRQNRSAGMDVGGFWILALFEFFFAKLWICIGRKAEMFFLFLYSS